MGPISTDRQIRDEMVDLIMDGVRSILQNEVDVAVEEAKRLLDAKKSEILANASLRMMRSIRLEKVNHDLVIYIALEEKEDGRV